MLCPLYNRNIGLGKYLDVNYERLGFIKLDNYKDLTKTTGKSESELSRICESCPN